MHSLLRRSAPRDIVSGLALLLATPAFAEYGRNGYNGVLDGLGDSDSYVLVEDPDSQLNPTVNGTVEAWVYPESFDHALTVVSKAKENWELLLTDKGDIRLVALCGYEDLGITLPLNQWTHLAVTWEADGDGSQTSVYVNGILVGNPYVSVGSNCEFDFSKPLTIGASLSHDSPFEGQIDELRLWDHARSVEQIRRNRFVGIGDGANVDIDANLTSGLEYDGLMASWNFNDLGLFAYEFIQNWPGTYEGKSYAERFDLPPIAYNQAMRCYGGKQDYMVFPDSPGDYNQTKGGTIDLWVRAPYLQRTVLLSRGKDLQIRMGGDGTIEFLFNGVSVASGKPAVAVDRFTHLAVTWRPSEWSEGYSIGLFADGVLVGSGNANVPFPVGGDLWVGHAPNASGTRPFDGYVDEVRWFSGARDQQDIRRMMFSSGRGHEGTSDDPVARFSFDGNLKATASQVGQGTLDTGGDNACRFSSYTNEELEGAFMPWFEAHPTVINRVHQTGADNDFASQYHLRVPMESYKFLQAAEDSITLPENAPSAERFELFLAIQSAAVETTSCQLTHGEEKYSVFSENASSGAHVLSFFADDLPDVMDDATYPAPWGFVQPESSFTPKGGLHTGGEWELTCGSSLGGGKLQAWGLRFY